MVSKDFDHNNPLGNTLFNNIKTQKAKATQNVETKPITGKKSKVEPKPSASSLTTNNRKGNVVYITESNLEKKTQNKKKEEIDEEAYKEWERNQLYNLQCYTSSEDEEETHESD